MTADPAVRPLYDLEVSGRPATFATSHEKAWREKVSEAFGAATPSRPYEASHTLFRVAIQFRTPKPLRESEAWDLDNLVKPTLDAMESVFGRREGNWHRQPADDRVVALEASKRQVRDAELPGARITVWAEEGSEE